MKELKRAKKELRKSRKTAERKSKKETDFLKNDETTLSKHNPQTKCLTFPELIPKISVLIFDENCFVIMFSLKISMESLNHLHLDNIAYKRSGRFFDNQPLEVTIIL